MRHFGNKGPRRRNRLTCPPQLGLVALIALIVVGCSKPPAPAPTSSAAPASAAAPARAQPASEPVAEAPTSKKQKGGIPMDAFFDNPLEIVANSAVVASPAGEMPAAPATTANDTPAPGDSVAASGGGGLSELIPMDNVQSEVKKIQNRLKASLQGQGTYNGNYKDISVDGSVMAAMAGIALQHSGEASWKANAPVIRDLGLELADAAVGLGKDNYEKSKAAYEKLESVFGGSVPADAPKGDPKRPIHEAASRTGLMKRIEKARNHLRDNINTEAKLKSDVEGVLHETLIITTLGKMVAMEGYESADESDYQDYANALINGGKEASAAVKDQSFQKFTEAMNKVNKSCDQCHANYGTG